MRRLFVNLIASLVWLAAAVPVPAQVDEPRPPPAASNSAATPGAKWSLLPILFSSPDTGFAFGVLPQYIFRLRPDSRPSSVRLDAYYTLKRQYSIQLKPQIWLQQNAYRLASSVVFREWPTDFYGIGPSTPDDSEDFTERLVNLTLEGQRQIHPGLFAGARYTMRWASITKTEPEGVLDRGLVTGNGSGTASGVGVLLSWDTRDNVYFPSTGSYHQASVELYGGMAGSDYRFDLYTVDLRRYVSVLRGHVLAVQAAGAFSTGDPPFRLLPGVGDVLRGYPATRHIGRTRAVLQAEYRIVPVWWRLGLTVFGGVAEVADGIRQLDLRDVRWAVGIGVRFLLFRDEMITIRQDFGFGQGSSGDYLDLNEAF